jgi:hypothetical protein
MVRERTSGHVPNEEDPLGEGGEREPGNARSRVVHRTNRRRTAHTLKQKQKKKKKKDNGKNVARCGGHIRVRRYDEHQYNGSKKLSEERVIDMKRLEKKKRKEKEHV